MVWSYDKPKKIYGIDPRDYIIPENSTGTMDDLLHPFAYYISIEETFGHTFKEIGETHPILLINGRRPLALGLGSKEFKIQVIVPLSEKKDGKDVPVTREEQEKRLNELEQFLLHR